MYMYIPIYIQYTYMHTYIHIHICIYTLLATRVKPDREDASSMVTAGATASTTEGNSRASRESGLLCSNAHEEHIDPFT